MKSSSDIRNYSRLSIKDQTRLSNLMGVKRGTCLRRGVVCVLILLEATEEDASTNEYFSLKTKIEKVVDLKDIQSCLEKNGINSSGGKSTLAHRMAEGTARNWTISS